MPVGFESYNVGNLLQISADMFTPCVVARGAEAGLGWISNHIAIPPGVGDAPLILLRVPANVAIGAFLQTDTYFTLNCEAGYVFEWAVVSSVGTPQLASADNVGFELYNASGQVTFSSRRIYPRIQAIAEVVIPNWGGASYYGVGVAVPPMASTPWFIATDLCWAYEAPNGMSGSYPQHVYAAKRSPDNSLITVEARSMDSFAFDFAFNRALSPYTQRPLRVPLCHLAGA